MAIRKMEELVQNGLDRAIELIVLAAHNSYRFAARNTLKIIVAGKEEMEQSSPSLPIQWPTCHPWLQGTDDMLSSSLKNHAP